MSARRRAVVVFAKWPRPGRAKRRLARAIGAPHALRLARAFLGDTVALAEQSGAERLLIAYAPPSARAHFARFAPDGITLVPQPRAAFGQRLRRALEAAVAGRGRAVLIGMDSPTVPASLVRRAFRALDRADCVLGPATDGGYYLIGARAPLPSALFRAMPWGTSRVLRETLRRASDAGLVVALLPRWYDVDDGAGLRRLLRDRAGLARARATRAALAELGLF